MYLKEIHYSGRVLRLPKKWLLAMKLTTLLLFLSIMTVSASSLAQKVSANFKNASLESVLNTLKQQTGYDFVYDETLVQNKTVNVRINQLSLTDALDKILGDAGLTYAVNDKVVTIKAQAPGLLDKIKSELNLDKIDVHGKVIGDDGQTLPGATVIIKGTNNSTITDAKGEFTLHNVSVDATVVITFIGFNRQETQVAAEMGTIRMVQTTNPLDAVQVIAYGQTSRRLSTGNVSTVTAKDLEDQPVENPLVALEGLAPGIFVTQSTGIAGGAVTVNIQGRNSIANGTDPFYVIDGVPYMSEMTANIGGAILGTGGNDGSASSTGGGNPLNYLNTADIESISILKGADATAIYGSRAANGAILITTKKGQAGKTRLSANIYSGIGQAPQNVRYLNTTQYLAMRHDAFKNDGITPDAGSAPDLLLWDTTRYTNWQNALIGSTARYDDAQLSLSGGNANTQFLFSGGYHRQSSVFPYDGADQRGSIHVSLTNTSDDKKFKFVFGANYMADNNNLPSQDLTQFTNTSPDSPKPFNADGTLNWENSTFQNPDAYLLYTYQAQTNNLISNATLSYNILKGLDIKSNFGYTNMQATEIAISPISAQNPAYQPTGGAGFTNNSVTSWLAEPQITYNFAIGPHTISALLGATFEENTTKGLQQQTYGYTSDQLLQDIQAAPHSYIASDIDAVYKYNAFFGRLNYNYRDKYLLDLNFRRDGSSRFGADNQLHDFGAVGAAWVFSEEPIIKHNLPFLSFGKFRASYGTTGNDQIDNYKFYSLYNPTFYPYQGVTGLQPINLSNPDLQWELTKKSEVGLSLGVIKDRVIVDVNYFINRSSNQLLSSPLPSITGFSTIQENLPATVENKGWELSLKTENFKNQGFNWTTSFNLTIPVNKLISFPGLASSPFANSYIIGESISGSKYFHMIGVDPKTGIYQFADSKGAPTFTPEYGADQNTFINLTPTVYGGMQNTLTYKGLSLTFFFQFTKQRGINPLFTSYFPPGFFYGGNQPVAVLAAWKQTGDHSTIEQFTQTFGSAPFNAYKYAQGSDAAFTNASFIRLKNLSITYALPQQWITTLHVQAASVYLEGQNLWTITPYKGIDPETQGLAIPPLRVITLGLKISI